MSAAVLLIDNYDSFTFNLQHLLAAEFGELPTVCHNDGIPFEAPRHGEFRALVISPGPGKPEKSDDFGDCRQAILEFDLPILGSASGIKGSRPRSAGRSSRRRRRSMARRRRSSTAGRRCSPGCRGTSRRSATTRGSSPSRCRNAWR